MKRKLYYTVYIETYDDGTPNGIRRVTVYEIVNDTPNQLFTVESSGVDAQGYPDESNEEAIQNYLDDNGYSDETFEFIEL